MQATLTTVPDIIEIALPEKLLVGLSIEGPHSSFYPIALPSKRVKVRLSKKIKIEVLDMLKKLYNDFIEMQYNELLNDPT